MYTGAFISGPELLSLGQTYYLWARDSRPKSASLGYIVFSGPDIITICAPMAVTSHTSHRE